MSYSIKLPPAPPVYPVQVAVGQDEEGGGVSLLTIGVLAAVGLVLLAGISTSFTKPKPTPQYLQAIRSSRPFECDWRCQQARARETERAREVAALNRQIAFRQAQRAAQDQQAARSWALTSGVT